MNPKSPDASKTVLTDLVLPSDTNPLGNLFGGELLSRMDRAACIAAERHAGNVVVTCLLYTSPSPRDGTKSRMPSSA